jgi:hypothetical protein
MFSNMFRQLPQDPSRRSFMIGAGVAMAALPLLGESEAEADVTDALTLSPPFNPAFDTPKGMLETYIKMAGDTSGKPYGGYFSGHVFSWLPNKCITPLMGVTGFGLGSDHRQKDGSFQHIWHEVGFYTDLKTGKPLTEWVNPLNGETCEVVPINNKSVNLTFSPHLADPAKLAKMGFNIMPDNFTADPNDPAHPYGLPYAIIGDQLSVFADSVGLIPSVLDPAIWKKEAPGPMINVGEFYMLTGSKRAVLDPAVTNVPVTGSWTRLGPYLPWMLMGQSAGHIFYRTTTKKIAGPWELPKSLQAYTEKTYPAFMKFPTDFSVPIENSWDVYKHTHTPKA